MNGQFTNVIDAIPETKLCDGHFRASDASAFSTYKSLHLNPCLSKTSREALRWFAKLLGGDKRIIRKAELIRLIAGHLRGDQLRELWRQLDQIQQAALSEYIWSV